MGSRVWFEHSLHGHSSRARIVIYDQCNTEQMEVLSLVPLMSKKVIEHCYDWD